MLLACGCPLSPRTVDLRPDTGDRSATRDTQRAADLELSTLSVDFGSVAVGDEHTKTLTIDNIGDATLVLEDFELEDASAPFAVGEPSEVSIPPGEQSRVDLIFEPVAHGHDNTALLIHSNDDVQPTTSVDLNGDGIAPVLEVEPGAVELGPVWIGCDDSQRLVLYNAGGEGMLISAAELESDSDELAFALAEATNGPLPWSLGAGSTLELGSLAYQPVDTREDEAYLTVASADLRVEEVRVDVQALAQAWEQVQDAFVVPFGQAEVVVALDRSQSLDPYLEQVRAALPLLVAALEEQGVDYQVAVVVDDDGCVNGELGWIDTSLDTNDVEDAVLSMSLQDGGSAALAEKAFLMLEQALSADNTEGGGCNEGMLRAGAALHLLGVSDEREQSSGSWQDHATALENLASDPSLVRFHAIAGDDAGCGMEAFEPFDNAVAASGGVQVSLCSDDWEGDMAALAANMAELLGPVDTQGPWSLSQQPVEGSITVSTDEVQQLNGWSYDGETNGVMFDPEHAPAPGATIAIDYAAQPEDCSQTP